LPVAFFPAVFLNTASQAENGARDGVTGELGSSVDGLSFDDHHAPVLAALARVVHDFRLRNFSDYVGF
jgi:hypothetical protein